MLPPHKIVTLGRYVLLAELATGGMATVYLGRLQGPVGFSRIVAIKRMHAHIARDADFALMFLDEARLAARVQHPNVVSTVDVVSQSGELFIVMEYVRGESLASLLRLGRQRIQAPLPVAIGIMVGALAGLHAAHEARGDDGAPLCIVHRDVSPHNVLVGADGLARIVDFGVAKAAVRSGSTNGKEVKGKLCYMSPEQLTAGALVDRRTDVFAAGAVLWEALAGRRLFEGEDSGAIVAHVLAGKVPPLREFRDDVPRTVEAVIRSALIANPGERYATAQQFADALESAAPKVATARTIGEWVRQRAGPTLARREGLVSSIESSASAHAPPRDSVPSAVASVPLAAPSGAGYLELGPAPAEEPAGAQTLPLGEVIPDWARAARAEAAGLHDELGGNLPVTALGSGLPGAAAAAAMAVRSEPGQAAPGSGPHSISGVSSVSGVSGVAPVSVPSGVSGVVPVSVPTGVSGVAPVSVPSAVHSTSRVTGAASGPSAVHSTSGLVPGTVPTVVGAAGATTLASGAPSLHPSFGPSLAPPRARPRSVVLGALAAGVTLAALALAGYVLIGRSPSRSTADEPSRARGAPTRAAAEEPAPSQAPSEASSGGGGNAAGADDAVASASTSTATSTAPPPSPGTGADAQHQPGRPGPEATASSPNRKPQDSYLPDLP